MAGKRISKLYNWKEVLRVVLEILFKSLRMRFRSKAKGVFENCFEAHSPFNFQNRTLIKDYLNYNVDWPILNVVHLIYSYEIRASDTLYKSESIPLSFSASL